MRKAARAIIIKNQSILVMKRNKFGHEYYTLLGGGIESGETADVAVVREVKEEASIDVTNPRLVYIEDAGEPYGLQYIFLCDFTDGEVKLSPDSIEAQFNTQGKNLHEPLWLPISKLGIIPFRSQTLQAELLVGLRDGFPSEPKMLTSHAEITSNKS
jgi:ADP-ribose pyrophosphatase YjhB (NUDIX family)